MCSHYTRHTPFNSVLKEIYCLNKPGSSKETYHVVLDISKSGIQYCVGDSVGILPAHDPLLVQKTLDALNATGQELIKDKRSLEERTLREHLMYKVNITKIHQSLLQDLLMRHTHPTKKLMLQELMDKTNHESLMSYMHSFELWDFLLEHPEVSFSAQEIVDVLPPLLPRFYSIASALDVSQDEIHLTVAMSDFETNGKKRYGVGTHFLCRLARDQKFEIPAYIQPSNGFTLPPSSDSPIIMVGPGTGIAPFRAFMQKRVADQSKGKNWLFFGECTRAHDFYYEDFWNELVSQNKLRLDVAFSRDQEHKIYVQHKMLEQKEEIWQWLEKGAYLYVCGDLHHMAKDVDAALHTIIQDVGLLSEDDTKAYMKKLRKEKRYLRDVY